MPEPADQLDRWIAEASPRALAYAQSLVRQQAEAEDLVHSCLDRLLARASEYDLPRDGTKILFKAITHAAINCRTRRKPTVGIEGASAEGQPVADAGSPPPDQVAMGNELGQAVHD